MTENNIFYTNYQGFCTENPSFRTMISQTIERNSAQSKVTTVIEPRTREKTFSHALSFEIFDPLWMLARQWQYSRFEGNDCGTPCVVKVRSRRRMFDTISRYSADGKVTNEKFSSVEPLEYLVEREDRNIDLYAQVESALYLARMLRRNLSKETAEQIISLLMKKAPLSDPMKNIRNKAAKTIDDLKVETNEALLEFYETYKDLAFNGNVANTMVNSMNGPAHFGKDLYSKGESVFQKYNDWFAKKFRPVQSSRDQECWNIRSMSYKAELGVNGNIYSAEDYDSGNLSWYSFDKRVNTGMGTEEGVKMLSYIPTPAMVPGSPSRKLYGFEDQNVLMGIENDTEYAMIANSTMMQYISMYSNDWMIIPLESEAGSILDVDGILVKDTFGEMIYITNDADKSDTKANPGQATGFNNKWNLFGTAYKDAYETANFKTPNGIIIPGSVQRVEESKPIEEVQYLRDELANMLWAVETVIPDNCGGTIDGKRLSDAVLDIVDTQVYGDRKDASEESEESNVKSKNDPLYSYLVQNRVPINWIPLVPEAIDARNIVFRRGKMPIYYNDQYNAVRASTKLMRPEGTGTPKPLYINEEEVTGYGVKIVKTAQRTRWFNGRSFNWVGNKKIISDYQANSGLMFDELVEKASGKAISLERIPEPESNLPK